MANYLRILYLLMNNKIVISAFCLILAFSAVSQEASERAPENAFASVIQENKIDIYPNPAVEFLVIQVSNSTLENIEFELHSIIGNQMSINVQDLGQGKFRIPVENFATGYYFVVVKDEEMRFKRAYKFLKD
ncbi:MAG: T9SS type A sorting domain-containing protein [Cyclobacteriaceae bacterium]